MAAVISALAGRTTDFEDVAARVTEANRARMAESAAAAAQPQTQQNTPGADTARPVDAADEAAQKALGDASGGAARPTLSPEIRSILLEDKARSDGPNPTIQIISRLVDALRAYENTPR